MKNLRKDNGISISETKTKICLAASFFVPILILLVIAYKFKLYPFSSDCFATESLQGTYLPVITELRRKILNRESLFYTWNAGGGSNFWAWICAYASSPFVLLYLLFPADKIAQATQVVFALKAAVASLCFFLLLWKKENTVSPVSVAMAAAYGLCGYVLTYSQEPWVLDTVILLPLLILALRSLVLGKRRWTFSLVCALTGITCCRSGVYMLMFVIIMFPLLYIEARHENKTLGRLPDIIKDFFIYTCIGIALSAFVWYPSLQTLWKTVPGNEVIDFSRDIKVDMKAWDFLERAAFSPSVVFPADTAQLPSIYCGIFPVMLVILYAFSPRIRFSEKVYCFSTLFFIYVTMCFSFFNFIIHGLHFPITGKYPQAILITFLVLYMGGRLISREKWVDDRRHLFYCAGMLIAFMVIRASISNSYSYASYVVYMAVGLLAAYYALSFRIHEGPENEKMTWLGILAAVMVLETGFSFYHPIKEKYYHEVTSRAVVSQTPSDGLRIDPEALNEPKPKKTYALDSSVLYKNPDISEKNLISEMQTLTDGGARLLLSEPKWNNYGLLYGVPAFSSDSYLTPERYSEVLRKMGINLSSDESRILPGKGTPVTDIFMQARFFEAGSLSSEEKEEIRTSVNGFFLTTANAREDLFVTDSPFEVQNKLAYQLASVYPFTDMRMEIVETENIVQEEGGIFYARKKGERAEIVLESEDFLTDPNIPIYLYCTSEQEASIEINLIDVEGSIYPLDRFNYTAGSCPQIKAGIVKNRRLQIKLSIYSPTTARFKFFVSYVDREKMEWFQSTMKDNSWKLKELHDGSATGTVNALSSGNVVWSIPYDKGWTVTIDGERTRTFSAYKAFLGINIPAGEHEITIRYTPDGFMAGSIVSGAALFMLTGLGISRLFPKKKTEASAEIKETEEEEKEA